MNIFDKIISFFRNLFGHKDNSVAVVPVPPPYTGWSITQGSAPGHVSNSFNFPLGINASQVWISYVEKPYTSLANNTSIELNYTITGDNPVFDHSSPNNVSEGPSTVRLLLHQAGDNLSGVGPYSFYRWFSKQTLPLALGTNTITVPLTLDNWTPVYAGEENNSNFASCLGNIGSIGFVFGGGYFAGHGVCLTSGSATFTINSMMVT